MPLELLPESEWLARRKLSASRIAAVYTERIGLLTLWAILTGKEQEEFPELLGDFGRATEPVSRKWMVRELGHEGPIWPPAPTYRDHRALLVSGKGPLTASPDTGFGEPFLFPRFAEHKTCDRVMAWKWASGPDLYAWVQIQATFAAADAAGHRFDGAYATVLIGNGYDPERDFQVFDVERDESFIGEVREWAERFWRDHVKADVPPPPDGLDATLKTLRLLFPPRLKSDDRKIGVLPATFAGPYKRLKAIEKSISDLERQKAQIRQEIEYAMGEAGLDEASIAASEELPNPPRFQRLRYTAHYKAKEAEDREISKFQELK